MVVITKRVPKGTYDEVIECSGLEEARKFIAEEAMNFLKKWGWEGPVVDHTVIREDRAQYGRTVEVLEASADYFSVEFRGHGGTPYDPDSVSHFTLKVHEI